MPAISFSASTVPAAAVILPAKTQFSTFPSFVPTIPAVKSISLEASRFPVTTHFIIVPSLRPAITPAERFPVIDALLICKFFTVAPD